MRLQIQPGKSLNEIKKKDLESFLCNQSLEVNNGTTASTACFLEGDWGVSGAFVVDGTDSA
jgi:hypothetical protein